MQWLGLLSLVAPSCNPARRFPAILLLRATLLVFLGTQALAGTSSTDPAAGASYTDPAGASYTDPAGGASYTDPAGASTYTDPAAGTGGSYTDPAAGTGGSYSAGTAGSVGVGNSVPTLTITLHGDSGCTTQSSFSGGVSSYTLVCDGQSMLKVGGDDAVCEYRAAAALPEGFRVGKVIGGATQWGNWEKPGKCHMGFLAMYMRYSHGGSNSDGTAGTADTWTDDVRHGVLIIYVQSAEVNQSQAPNLTALVERQHGQFAQVLAGYLGTNIASLHIADAMRLHGHRNRSEGAMDMREHLHGRRHRSEGANLTALRIADAIKRHGHRNRSEGTMDTREHLHGRRNRSEGGNRSALRIADAMRLHGHRNRSGEDGRRNRSEDLGLDMREHLWDLDVPRPSGSANLSQEGGTEIHMRFMALGHLARDDKQEDLTDPCEIDFDDDRTSDFEWERDGKDMREREQRDGRGPREGRHGERDGHSDWDREDTENNNDEHHMRGGMPTPDGRSAPGGRPAAGVRPATGDRTAPDGRPAAGVRPATGDRTAPDGRPAGGRPATGDRTAPGGRPATGVRPATGDRTASGGRPATGVRPATGDRTAPGGKATSRGRPGHDERGWDEARELLYVLQNTFNPSDVGFSILRAQIRWLEATQSHDQKARSQRRNCIGLHGRREDRKEQGNLRGAEDHGEDQDSDAKTLGLSMFVFLTVILSVLILLILIVICLVCKLRTVKHSLRTAKLQESSPADKNVQGATVVIGSAVEQSNNQV